jgi:hypothetical protein
MPRGVERLQESAERHADAGFEAWVGLPFVSPG